MRYAGKNKSCLQKNLNKNILQIKFVFEENVYSEEAVDTNKRKLVKENADDKCQNCKTIVQILEN